jgi:hypothetical protein
VRIEGDTDANLFYTDATNDRIGVGTITPTVKFEVNGAAKASSLALTTPLPIASGGTGLSSLTANYIPYGNGTGAFQSSSNFTFDGTSLLLGTTGGYYLNNKVVFLQTSSTNSGNALAVATGYSSDVGNAAMLIGKFDNDTSTSQVFTRFLVNNAGLGSGQINANGAGAVAFGTFSDKQLKENIADLSPQLAKIMALRPVEFDYIASEGGGHQTGFIAQEMQNIYPDSVGKRSLDKMLTLTGWSKTEARLVKAIQEQQEFIKLLELRIKTLENK